MKPTWREQYDRVKRWHTRLSESKRLDENESAHELRRLDSARAFFVECHHLVDWLANDPTVPAERSNIKTLMHDSEWLWRCGEIADGFKHARVRKGRLRPADGALLLENGDRLATEAGEGILLEGLFIVASDGREWAAAEAADECFKEWERVLRRMGLIVQ